MIDPFAAPPPVEIVVPDKKGKGKAKKKADKDFIFINYASDQIIRISTKLDGPIEKEVSAMIYNKIIT